MDWAEIEANPEDDKTKFVMTTWHENEPLEDVFWFAQFCAIFSYDDELELRDAVILHVSEIDRKLEYLKLFEQSKTLADREPD